MNLIEKYKKQFLIVTGAGLALTGLIYLLSSEKEEE